MIHNLYKYRGETPLECIRRFVDSNPELKKEKFTYLGRLDPMADGVLLVASGEDIKLKNKFLGLDKNYDFNILFGFATDTYDCLGKVVRVEKLENVDENQIRRVAKIFEGERQQKYPPFSSKTINGKSLFQLKREGTLNEEDIPSIIIHVYKLEFHKLDKLSSKELMGKLLMDIGKVKGDFRQNETLILWQQVLLGLKNNDHFIGRFSAHVSSGTYIRGIANDLGNTLGCGACALSITRTRLGDYKIEDSIK